MFYKLKNKDRNAIEATRNFHSVYGTESLTERNYRKWFWKDYCDLRDVTPTGRSVEFNNNLIVSEFDRNSSVTVEELSWKPELKPFNMLWLWQVARMLIIWQ